MFSNSNAVDCDAAARFVEALSEMPNGVWLSATLNEIGSSVARPTALDTIAAHARELRLGLILWKIADDVETAAWYVLPRNWRTPRTRGEAAQRSRALMEAKTAASAILLRRYLTTAQFDALYSSLWPAPHEGLMLAK